MIAKSVGLRSSIPLQSEIYVALTCKRLLLMKAVSDGVLPFRSRNNLEDCQFRINRVLLYSKLLNL